MNVRKKINKIHKLCLDINGLKERDSEVSGNLPAVFHTYSPHVAELAIRVFEKGWNEEAGPDIEFRLKTDEDDSLFSKEDWKEAIKYLKKLKEDMKVCQR